MELLVSYTRSLKSKRTCESYLAAMNRYMRFASLNMEQLIVLDQKVAQELIIKYLIKRQDEGISYGLRYLELCSIKHLYENNDISLNWKKIKSYMGEEDRKSKDRPYTHEEIKQILTKCDERKRVIVLLLASSGMRLGALPGLKLSNLKKMDNLYQITVYENTKEEHITFCSPEGAQAIDSYLEYRRNYGEKLTSNSPLLRNQFDRNDPFDIAKPRPITIKGLAYLLYNMVLDSNLRTRPIEGQKYQRTEVSMAHGFRKFFVTQLTQAKVNPVAVELLVGHDIGIKGSYYRPTTEDLLDAYSQGIDALTINEENRLKKHVVKLKSENDELKQYSKQIDEMKSKEQQKDKEINTLTETVAGLSDQVMKMMKQMEEIRK